MSTTLFIPPTIEEYEVLAARCQHEINENLLLQQQIETLQDPVITRKEMHRELLAAKRAEMARADEAESRLRECRRQVGELLTVNKRLRAQIEGREMSGG